MPLTQIYNFDLTLQLDPAQYPEDARIDAVQWAANLTVNKGDPIAILTSGNKASPYTGTNGTGGAGVFKGLSKFTLTTDAAGLVYLGSSTGAGTNAVASLLIGPSLTAPIYTAGTFDTRDFTTNLTTLADLRTGMPMARITENGFVKIG
jgi:hypothetical protein